MAASLGATSLENVHHEGLNELLRDLANVYPSDDFRGPSLGVPMLDALVNVFMLRTHGPVPESQHQDLNDQVQVQTVLQEQEPDQQAFESDDEEMLLADQFDQETALPDDQAAHFNPLFSGSAYRNKRPIPVVEISSSLSAAGKSQLLYHLTALAVLPREYGRIPIGGQDAAAIFIDADDRFDVQRLQMIARGIMQKALKSFQAQEEQESETAAVSTDDIEAVIISALKHVHVFRPQSSFALIATLSNLDTCLYDVSRHYSASRPIQMLAIDSVTAFFWQDKLRDNLARAEELGLPNEEIDKLRDQMKSFHFVDLYAEIVRELKRLQALFGCNVVYTTTVSGARPIKKATDQDDPLGPYDLPPSRTPALRSALPAPWGTFPVLRLVVQRDPVRSFPPSMSAHDAKKDASMRQSAVSQGKFSAYVNAWGREEWPRRVIDGLKPYNDGSFAFYVREHAIEIPLPEQ
ncbi:hypothetical protein N7478_001946 [Penicillium angulare]|uniref:uncharacterized protein n=1 Tax=Penicillium angulare TaxID=116970 RepID=UPI00253FCC38|nr:uncharacterized protein N7478_001946 [Penicillium angulare]KAJ5288916.1 hypothetical protein N7478_001946 [Penicillium angulare]